MWRTESHLELKGMDLGPSSTTMSPGDLDLFLCFSWKSEPTCEKIKQLDLNLANVSFISENQALFTDLQVMTPGSVLETL